MSYYYICDACGTIVTITDAPIPEGEDWECGDCGCSAMWEFTNKENALRHAQHITQLVRSGLVRRA